MIKMKALRSFGYAGVNEGSVSRGHEFQVRDDYRAKELEVHGLAYRIELKAEPKHLNKMEPAPLNKAADVGPLVLAGGTTGADAPVPLSPPDRPRRGRPPKHLKEGYTS